MSELELDDIQSGLLRPRPTPYAATYVLLRIDDRDAGRELMRRLSCVVSSASHPRSPAGDTWVSVALSFQGLKALDVPRVSLDSFAPEFRAGGDPGVLLRALETVHFPPRRGSAAAAERARRTIAR